MWEHIICYFQLHNHEIITQVWKVTAVLNILIQLTEKCKINEQLQALEAGEVITDEIAGEFGMRSIYTMTGYSNYYT